MNNRTERRVYLVTYSQADKNKFPTRESFGEAVKDAFNIGSGKVQSLHWATCQENHEDGGDHYHTAIKLSGPKRWLSAKNYLMENHGVSVHFSDDHSASYYAAYKYITKTDTMVHHSFAHPNFKEVGSPKTKKCMAGNRQRTTGGDRTSSSASSASTEEASDCKKRRLSNIDVAEFLVEHKIKNELELFSVANKQTNEGKKDLANFILTSKALDDLIKNTWKNGKLDRAAECA